MAMLRMMKNVMCILFVLAGSFAFGQQPVSYHNLALEGCDIRGIIIVAAPSNARTGNAYFQRFL
ncbi:hypothetical protein I2I11_12795 [Pontibacter sp. 172403-2]|uniref:hypothetical protein n=1 Tax=Pontibacter rufus TaxID=2791028 RepID=UPI0018AFA2E0|nr:hypothetical protein [Pontibacter sp. 172403-2]MBF9254175.1 hypothetical protein [Pontibacter sp. 172403-2]